MKRFSLFCLMLFLMTFVSFGQYKILYITTPEISIGGKILKVGDEFSENAPIEWTTPRQAVKVLNLSDNTQKLIVAEKYKKTDSKNLKSYLLAEQQLSTRKGVALSTLELGLVLNDTFYLLDPVMVETKLPIDGSHFFFVTFEYNGETINKKLESQEDFLIFDNSLFSIDGNPVPPGDLEMSVWYMDLENQNRTLVTDCMTLIPL